jgi:adenine specific DNA methylase Mod
MFSNLRTEPGYENHFFMPNAALANYQQTLVEIIESDHPRLQQYTSTAENPILLTRFEFERLLSETPADFTVRCRCGDEEVKTITKRDGVIEGTAIHDYTFLLGRFLIFRPISKGDTQLCVH